MKTKLSLIPGILFIFSFALRISLISKGSYHGDTLFLAENAEDTMCTLSLHPQIGFGYPLTVIIASLFLLISKIFISSDPVFAVNLMSVVLTSFCVPIFYFLLKKLLDDDIASLFGSIIFSISPIFLGVSVFGKSHAPSILFLLLGLLFILKFQEENKISFLLLSSMFIGFQGLLGFKTS